MPIFFISCYDAFLLIAGLLLSSSHTLDNDFWFFNPLILADFTHGEYTEYPVKVTYKKSTKKNAKKKTTAVSKTKNKYVLKY